MNASERAALLQIMKRYTKTKSASPETARAALVAEGIYTENGEISANYGGEPPEKRVARKR